MSATTAAKMVYRVRQLTKDVSQSDARNSLPEILDALDRALFYVHSQLPGGSSINSSFITLVGGTSSYNITEVDPVSLGTFWLANQKTEVHRKSIDVVLGYLTASPTSTGPPIIIGFTEAASGVTTARVWPVPAAADTMYAVVDTMVTTTFQGLAATDLTATSLNFGPYGTRAIEYLAAWELTPDRQDWRATAQKLIEAEGQRLAFQQAGEGFMEPMI